MAEIQHAELVRIFGGLVGIRMALSPLAAAAAGAVAYYHEESWRRALLGGGAVAIVLVSLYELVRFRQRGLARGSFALNLGVAVIGHLVITAATGAIESPLLPLLAPIALLSALFVRPHRVRLLFAAIQIVALLAFAWLGVEAAVPGLNLRWFGGGPRAGHVDALLWTTAGTMTLVVFVANGVGVALRRAFDTMVRRALLAREESLRAHADRARELTALSGEIAHELKNPMASVKGLASLLAKDLPQGKPAERMSVLRREVDRMQGILDEFLNFSRPLVPLALEAVDVEALCRETAALHEGMARDKGIRLAVAGESGRVRADPRKLKQVLLNLLQNAIDASGPGGIVEIGCERGDGGCRVRVQDRGDGLAPGVVDRIFEPGVTTKPTGSGLGLTIARALVRQHGGDLTLGPREGGGAVAQLWLPEHGPVVEVQEAGR